MKLRIEARNHILFHPSEVSRGTKRASLSLKTDARAVHLRSVLNVQTGTSFKAAVLNEAPYSARVLSVGPETLDLELASPPPPTNSSSLLDLTVLLACPRPKVFRRLLPQLTALGVSRLIVTKADKVEPVYFASHDVSSTATLEREILRGLEQACLWRAPDVILSAKSLKSALRLLSLPGEIQGEGEGGKLPWGVVRPPLFVDASSFPLDADGRSPSKTVRPEVTAVGAPSADSTGPCGNPRRSSMIDKPVPSEGEARIEESRNPPDSSTRGELRLLADPGGPQSLLSAVTAFGVQQRGARGSSVVLAIGPEGGWTDDEVALLRGEGFVPSSCGSAPLTTETFAVFGVGLVQEAFRVAVGGG